MEDTAERVGVLVEGTADKVARTAERLAELTEDAAARVSATLGQKDMSRQDEAGKEGGLREEADTDGGCLDRKAGTDGWGRDEESGRHTFAAERRERIAALSRRLSAITEKRHSLSSRMGYYRRSLLKGNPTASSSRFAEALKELREIADRKK